MKKFDFDKNYPPGIDGFNEAFADMYDKEEHEFLKIFGPLAEQMANGDFDNVYERMKEQIQPEIERLASTDLTAKQVIDEVRKFTQKMSPTLDKQLTKTMQNHKLTFNATEVDQENILWIEEKLKQFKSGEVRHYRKEEIPDKIKEFEEKLIIAKTPEPKTSGYTIFTRRINIDRTFTEEDVRTLIHELIHADAAPPYLEANYQPNREYSDEENATIIGEKVYTNNKPVNNYFEVVRFGNMISYSKELARVFQILNKFEEQGKFTKEQAEKIVKHYKERFSMNTLAEVGPYWAHEVIDPLYDITPAKYFFGTATSHVVAPQIKNSEDFENMLDIMKDEKLSPLQRMQKLGVTQESVQEAITEFVSKVQNLSLNNCTHDKQSSR